MSPSSELPPPAALMRRMTGQNDSPRVTLSANASDPLLRVRVESVRGHVIVHLPADLPADTAVQWTQNGVPIPGATGSMLHLASVTSDATDLYWAQLHSPGGEARSQSFLLVVVAGHPVLNWSVRGFVAPEHPLTGGCVIGRGIGPVGTKRYLIRGVGRTLARFGVTNPVRQPVVEVLRRGAKWEGLEILDATAASAVEAQQRVGAFALEEPATEFVAIGRLPPGPYTIVGRPAAGDSGELLLELYELPD